MSASWHVRVIDEQLPTPPFIRSGGSLLMMVGLPGVGKSLLVDTLSKLVPVVVIRTDMVRFLMRNHPSYTSAEMMWVYQVCQKLIEMRLRRGQRVIFDATNYKAARRDRMFEIAGRVGATVAVCHVQAAEETIRDRLRQRNSGDRRDGDLSEADWSVYQWMVHAQEPIDGPHLILDTTATPADVLAVRLRKYWFACEQNVPSNAYLQSSRWPD